MHTQSTYKEVHIRIADNDFHKLNIAVKSAPKARKNMTRSPLSPLFWLLTPPPP